MLPLLSMLQIVNKFSEVESYFRKLSFWSNKFVKQILLTHQKFKKVKKDFCCGNYKYLGGSKEQWQNIAEMQIMLQNVNKFCEVETYFRKLSFWNNKFVKQILLTQKF